VKVKIFFSEIGHDLYQKTQNFMLISKMQTYLSDKMHLKKVITKNMLNWDLTPKIAGIFGITFYGCIFAGVYAVAAAEETEGACFGADFSSVHSQNDSRICLNSLARKKSSLFCVINCDSALRSKPLSV
jgi:hypothetical protein